MFNIRVILFTRYYMYRSAKIMRFTNTYVVIEYQNGSILLHLTKYHDLNFNFKFLVWDMSRILLCAKDQMCQELES
jgi:hypothetical protein